MPLGSGRKKTPVTSLFKEIGSLTGKMTKVSCIFCNKTFAKSGTRMEKHIQSCLHCPSEVKKKFTLHSEIESPKSTNKIFKSVGPSCSRHTSDTSRPSSSQSFESRRSITSHVPKQIMKGFLDRMTEPELVSRVSFPIFSFFI